MKDGLNIDRADNGWIVRYGCATFVFDNGARLLAELSRYVSNPDGVLAEYTLRVNAIRQRTMQAGVLPPPTAPDDGSMRAGASAGIADYEPRGPIGGGY